MVVSEVPGTTRDAIDTVITHEGQEVVLVDTAGIRRRGQINPGVEKYSVLRSLRAIMRSDVALLVTDATEPFTAQDTHIAGTIVEQGKGAIILVNKWDLRAGEPNITRRYQQDLRLAFKFMPWMPVLFTSALTGFHVGRVLGEALAAAAQRRQRIGTGQLNELIADAVAAHPPTVKRRRQLKIYYATQVAIAPPTFVLFVNDPGLLHYSYRRYLENAIRRRYPFRGASLRVIARQRDR